MIRWNLQSCSTLKLCNILNILNHSGGYYIFLEASNRRPGDKAVITSPVQSPTPSGGNCFVLWYHMFGPQIGQLNIRLLQNGRFTTIGHLSGTQGNQWKQFHSDIHSNTDYQVNLPVFIFHEQSLYLNENYSG